MKFVITYMANGNKLTATAGNNDFALDVRQQNGRTTVVLHAHKRVELLRFEQEMHFSPASEDLCFLNGYQSWTDTKEFFVREREHSINRVPKFIKKAFALDRYGDAMFYDYNKNRLHGYDVFYCKGSIEKYVLNLNYRCAYLLIELDKKAQKLLLSSDFNGTVVQAEQDFTVADYIHSDSLSAGQQAFDAYFPQRPVQKILGYTSWYNYYQNISQDILLRDLQALDDRFDLFQIDDGYETFVGDWLDVDKTKFSNGLTPIVEEAHSRGFLAGIWIAPFVAERNSRLFALHPDWFCRFDNGEPVQCGSNWSGFYALNMDMPEVRSYIADVLHHYAQMGFDFFKLDFLYAANMCVPQGKSRSAAAEEEYAFLRECLPDKRILGCGATLFNCKDKFDYVRIGPDVSLRFDDVWYMRKLHRERISTKVTLQNTVFRHLFDERLFGNDPDVFLLRDDNIHLSRRQKKALLTLNALFGSVLMTSDNIARYDSAKRDTLNEALELFGKASVEECKRVKNTIQITFSLHGRRSTIVYNTEKGVLQ